MKRTIAVIDLKAFYSYVECIDRGLDPWSTPLVVADKERGKNTIVLSVTPYLKKRGVPSRLRVNDLPKGYDYIYAVPRMQRYIDRSCEVMSILLDFVAEEDLHIYSIDEAFMDLTSYLDYYQKTPYELVKYIIHTIKEKTGLECTAGIGDNFFLSKVALDIYAKKEREGIATLYKEDVKEKLWPITPLSKIWGIGTNLERRLNNLGIFTMKDLANSSRLFMNKYFGIIGEQLLDHANGIDEADIHEVYVPKETSLSIGQVLFKDYTPEECETIIREMSDDLCYRLRMERKLTGVVSLCIGYSKEGGFARQLSLLKVTDDNNEIYEALMEIYHRFVTNKTIRRVNINFGKLTYKPKHEQLDLFVDESVIQKSRNLNFIIDEIRNRYGENAVLRTTSLLDFSTIKERHNQIGGHRR